MLKIVYFILGLSLFPAIYSSPFVLDRRINESPRFKFASIGDSWAAGPAIATVDSYQGHWDQCALHKASWEAEMAGDDTWTVDRIDFKFAACSGAVLEDAAAGDNPQISKVDSPNLLTMQLGGNNARFSAIARACIYIGDAFSSQKDYPDPDGVCFHALKDTEKYLDEDVDKEPKRSFYWDHQLALKNVLKSDLIRGRDNFYLYIVSYAEFFNTSPKSDWCNEVSFGIVKSPKLSNALRSKMNELVRKANAVTARSVSDMKNDHIVSLDPSASFENHRFCEPGHSINNQYYLNDVWFWNLSAREDDPPKLSEEAQSAWVNKHIFSNGTTATEAQLLAMLPSPQGSDSSSGGRAFHPKDRGHMAIKDAMLSLLRKNKVPGIKQATTTVPPTERPYAMGQIHIHVNEYWGCLDREHNLSVQVVMWDSTGKEIGRQDQTQAGASAAARMRSKLEEHLIISPQWADGGYIQFQLGILHFNTNSDRDKTQPSYCNWGGYDPREGPVCVIVVPDSPPIYFPDAESTNQIDCWFPAVSFLEKSCP